MNYLLSNQPLPSDPKPGVCGSCYIQDTKFRVELVKTTYVNSNYEFGAVSTFDYGILNYGVDRENTLNIFFCFSNDYTNGGAFADGIEEFRFPPDPLENGDHFRLPFIVTRNYRKLNTTVHANATHLLHEIGHVFGLGHLYSELSGSTVIPGERCDYTTYRDFLDDLMVGQPCPMYLNNGGSNNCNPFSSNNDYCTNNVLGGIPEAYSFSPSQLGRMHRNAHLLSCRKFCYNTFPEDKNHDGTGEGQLHPLLINKNETWDFDIKLYSDIRVRSGNTLTVKCTIWMPYMSNIYVEPGAHLILDGGHIKADRDTTFWYGVHVMGDKTKAQYPPSNQGWLTMKNGASLENARHAATSSNGGIIQAENSNFINNRRSIGFNEYQNFQPNNPALKRNNISFFKNCTFEVNKAYDLPTEGQATFWKVEGIPILGCKFVNTVPITNGTYRGAGIRIVDSRLKVSYYCPAWDLSGNCLAPIAPSTIAQFNDGIILQGATTTNASSISNTFFDKNMNGAIALGLSGFSFTDNTFSIQDISSPNGPSCGLQLNGSYFFDVTNNHYSGLVYNTEGIIAQNCGSYNNEINENSFSDLHAGIHANGLNTNGFFDPSDELLSTGLNLTCNSYHNAGDHEFISGNDPTQHGIRRVQTHGLVAGNAFTGTRHRHIYLYRIPSNSQNFQTLPIDRYYYSTLDANAQPFVGVNSGVTIIDVNTSNDCNVNPGQYIGISHQLAALYNDTIDHTEEIKTLLAAHPHPYTDLERTLIAINEGQTADASELYEAIKTSYSMQPQEAAEFNLGTMLIHVLISHRINNEPLTALSTTEIDDLRYVVSHATMWAKAKACNLLYIATGTECPRDTIVSYTPEIEGNERIAQTPIVAAYTIYPNPTTDIAVLSRSVQEQIAEVRFTDVSGRAVAAYEMPAGVSSIKLDVSQWSRGVYLYHIYEGNRLMHSGRLVK